MISGINPGVFCTSWYPLATCFGACYSRRCQEKWFPVKGNCKQPNTELPFLYCNSSPCKTGQRGHLPIKTVFWGVLRVVCNLAFLGGTVVDALLVSLTYSSMTFRHRAAASPQCVIAAPWEGAGCNASARCFFCKQVHAYCCRRPADLRTCALQFRLCRRSGCPDTFARVVFDERYKQCCAGRCRPCCT